MYFDLADLNLCFYGILATGTRSRVKYAVQALIHLQSSWTSTYTSAEQFYTQYFHQFSASEAP